MPTQYENQHPFVIRKFDEGDQYNINRQFNRIFRQSRSLEEWSWKFQHPNQSKIMIACNEAGEVVTHYALVTDKLQYFGKLFLVGHSVDTFSFRLPEAVNSRLFEKVVHQFFETFGFKGPVSLMYGFPGTRILKLGRMKLDYGEAIPIKYWEKNIASNLRVGQILKVEHKCKMSKVDDLWRRAKDRYPVSIVRNGNWIQKRYLTKPGHGYKCFRTSWLGRYTALAIYVVQKTSLVLVDLVWDGGNKSDLKVITLMMLKVAKRLALPKVCMWLSGDHEAEMIFSDLGWQVKSEPQGLHMVVKTFNDDILRDVALKKFYLTKGCSDII